MRASHDAFERSVRALREVTATDAGGDVTRLRILGRLVGQKRRRHSYEALLLGLILFLSVPAVSAAWNFFKREPDRPSVPQWKGPKRASTASRARALIEETSRTRGSAPSLPASQVSRGRPEAKPSEIDVYAEAHDAHFHAQDFGRALPLWTAYVGRYPHGRFLPEAELNRAVCLVRLGDRVAAREVLLHLIGRAGPDDPKKQAEQLLAEIR